MPEPATLISIVALLFAAGAVAIALRSTSSRRSIASLERRVATLSLPSNVRTANPNNSFQDLREIEQLKGEVIRLRLGLDRLRSDLENRPSVAPASSQVNAPFIPAPLHTPSHAIPVEYNGDVLRRSQSDAALGALRPSQVHGRAELFLNEEIEVDHFAMQEWSQIFEFGSGRAYERYRTISPASVDWDEISGEGRLRSKGIAEPLL